MTIVNKLALQNQIGIQSNATMEAAVVAALALTPYVRFIDESIGVRKYFFDIIHHCTPVLNTINEVYPINLDSVMLRAYKVFSIRYHGVVYASPSAALSPINPVHQAFLAASEEIPPTDLTQKLLKLFQSAVQGGV